MAGRYDGMIRARAQDLKAFVDTYGTTYLSFQHEANVHNDAQPAGCSNPSDYVSCGREFKQLWAYVQRLFLAELGTSAPRVKWVPVLTASAFNGSRGGPDNWLGGLTYDYVGVDVYNWTDCHAGEPAWISFRARTQTSRDYALARGKQLWVGEVGTKEDPTCGGTVTSDPVNANGTGSSPCALPWPSGATWKR